MKIKFVKTHENAVAPIKAHATDAGFDLTATSRTFDEHGAVVYGTGIAVEIPAGYVGLVFPRSSVSKFDLSMANALVSSMPVIAEKSPSNSNPESVGTANRQAESTFTTPANDAPK